MFFYISYLIAILLIFFFLVRDLKKNFQLQKTLNVTLFVLAMIVLFLLLVTAPLFVIFVWIIYKTKKGRRLERTVDIPLIFLVIIPLITFFLIRPFCSGRNFSFHRESSGSCSIAAFNNLYDTLMMTPLALTFAPHFLIAFVVLLAVSLSIKIKRFVRNRREKKSSEKRVC